MSIESLISTIDSEIRRLEEAKQLLTGKSTKRGPGRPRLNSPITKPKKSKRPPMSAAARAKIAAAQKKRWAKAKKSKPVTAKTEAKV